MMVCSVVVPAYNAVHVLPRCLIALTRQSIDRSEYEIIVADDGSTDATVSQAEQCLTAHPQARVLRAAHGGPAAARNAGVRAARGDLVLFTDADCEPAPDWMECMVRAFDDPQVAGAKGVYRTRQTSLVARFVQQEYEDKYDRLAGRSSIDFVDTYSAAYRRDVFLASGGFDVSFTTASVEDQELSFRLAAQGHRLVFVPEAIVDHQHDTTPLEYLRRKYGIGYWKALLLRSHPDKAVHDSHTPQMIKVQMGLLAVGTVLLVGWSVGWLVGWLVSGLAAIWLMLFVSMMPLLIKIARRDPAVVWIAPILIALRAFGLGLGLMVGLARFSLRRIPSPAPDPRP
jgi:cellulose synthase/poly-beta-1,6-N-acetylglucosamine synthase-like glycosyltransferase